MADTSQQRRFLTTEQVADELNVGLPTVRALLTSGLWRIGVQDLEDYTDKTYLDTAERIAGGDAADEK